MQVKQWVRLAIAAAILAVTAGPAAAGKDDNSLVWATDRELNVPLVWWNATTEMAALMYHIFDTLVYRNPDTGEYDPLLAKSWTWIDDTTIEFELRDDVVFHNGDKFDADDVVVTYNTLLKPDSGILASNMVTWMETVEKIDDHSVRIHMDAPFPAALEFFAGTRMGILPSGAWEAVTKDATGKPDYATAEPIGTGPYKITEWVAGERAVLTRNEKYFDGPKGQPTIETLVFRTIPDAETRVAELMTGGIDWVMNVSKDRAGDLRGMPGIKVQEGPDMRISYLMFDVTGRSGDTPVTDLKVRQAIAHAIDRKTIASELVGEASKVVHSACYPEQVGCSEDVPRYDYDPEKARALLTEAGYGDGLDLNLYAYRDRPFTEAVMGYLREVGINAKLNFLQWQALRTAMQEGTIPFANMTWASSGLNDISAITSVFFKHTADDYCRDDEIKQWLDTGDSTIDPDKRAEAYRKALVRIQEKLCWLPLFSYAKIYAYNENLEFKPTADGFPLFYRASWK